MYVQCDVCMCLSVCRGGDRVLFSEAPRLPALLRTPSVEHHVVAPWHLI